MLQENLRAIQARDRTMAKRQQDQDEAEKVSIAESGGNPEEAMIKKKKMEEYEQQKL